MGKDLNGYFSSVFAREDISSLPVPDAKSQEAQIILFKAVNCNSGNGSSKNNEIPQKLLMETVEEISIQLARVQLVIKRRSGSSGMKGSNHYIII